MYLNLPIYETCEENEGGFFYFPRSWKKPISFFRNSFAIVQKTFLKMMAKIVNFATNL